MRKAHVLRGGKETWPGTVRTVSLSHSSTAQQRFGTEVVRRPVMLLLSSCGGSELVVGAMFQSFGAKAVK